MPRGPNGEKRPADVAQGAFLALQIATGEAEDHLPSRRRISGLAGAEARSQSLSAEDRKEIAKRAANARWADGTRRADMAQDKPRERASPASVSAHEFTRYPNNQLGEPKLAFEETSDLRAVVRKHFGVD